MLLEVFLFACIGVALEVAFTATSDYLFKHRQLHLSGNSYLWMFPLYGMVPIFLHLMPLCIKNLILPIRLSLYVLIIWIVEYLVGFCIQKIVGKCPWEDNYKENRWSIHNLIRLDYFPWWILACYLFEILYNLLHRNLNV